jgi:hypothetical protein
MSELKYRIDDEGNLVEVGCRVNGSGAQNGAGGDDASAAVTLEGARSTVKALVLSEVLGVLLLLGGAVYYEAQRTLLRRSIYKRVERDPLG